MPTHPNTTSARRRQITGRIRIAVRLTLAGALTGAALLTTSLSPLGAASEAHAASGPKAYVGLFKENAVAVLDTASGTVTSKIALPTGPHGVVATPDGKKVYVSSDGASTVSVIDTATDTISKTVEVGKSPHGVTLTPDGKTALVGVWGENQVAFLDTATDEVVRRAPVGAAHNIAVTPDGQFAYAGSQAEAAPALVKLNVATGAEVARLPLDGAPRGLSVRPDGGAVYVTRAGQEDVLALDTGAGQEIARIAVGASPHLPSFNQAGLGVVNVQGPGLLTSFDPATNTVLRTVNVGKNPHWQATSSDGKTVLETNEGSNDVSVVDLASMSVRATIPVGEAPRKIALLPGDVMTSAEGTSPQPATASMNIPGINASETSATVAAPASAAGSAEVRIERFSFGSPITVKVGQPVTWLNADAVPHTVTADDDSWDSEDLDPGQTYVRIFDAPGTYDYYCELHPHMRGEIVVR